jgi:hypothetical protein
VGIVIYMYVRDHGPAHFHARYGDDEAVIEISTGGAVQGALSLHRAELLDAWDRASSGEPPGIIEPLP